MNIYQWLCVAGIPSAITLIIVSLVRSSMAKKKQQPNYRIRSIFAPKRKRRPRSREKR